MAEPSDPPHGPGVDDHYYVAGYTVEDDPFVDANGVLLNNLGLTDTASLSVAEADLSSARLIELLENPIKGEFSLAHLCAIHGHIFQDVYPWAGQPRLVDTGKGDTMFLPHQLIEERFRGVTERLSRTRFLSDLHGDLEAFSNEAGTVFAEINHIHTFREGNGRTQREFLALLAARAGFEISWAGVSDRAMIEACAEARQLHEPSCRKLIRLIKLNATRLVTY
ncbi:Adenosine monophosphate-protein transferase VbhT [Pseudomonas reidholzensis]|uniref:protein adenylyltransferase n=1 Tax=Pseudomonas reidholzensis TaxID=1785162 RepID=A0A383RU33_9PSED|nr:Fic family protein [Pseudomonas reidholzensis]SYX90552.1 Adenosine monophosphate-protein transferase VbhT [Pseudomonas reidholzensis]